LRQIKDQDVLKLFDAPLAKPRKLGTMQSQGRAHPRLREKISKALFCTDEESIGQFLATVLREIDEMLNEIAPGRGALEDRRPYFRF